MPLINIDTDLLRTLIFVYDLGSFTRAAEKLYRTQSAISLQIKKLEELVGVQLLVRQPKTIELTPSGYTVYSYATKMLALNDSLVLATQSHPVTSRIKFGSPDDYISLCLKKISSYGSIPQFSEIEIHNELSPKLSDMVDNGDLDLALMTGITGINIMKLATLNFSWVCSPYFSNTDHNSLPLALFPIGCTIRDTATSLLCQSNIPYYVAYSSLQFSPLYAAIASSLAVGLVPSDAIPAGLVKADYLSLPSIPPVNLVIKVRESSDSSVHEFAASVAQAFALAETTNINIDELAD